MKKFWLLIPFLFVGCSRHLYGPDLTSNKTLKTLTVACCDVNGSYPNSMPNPERSYCDALKMKGSEGDIADGDRFIAKTSECSTANYGSGYY